MSELWESVVEDYGQVAVEQEPEQEVRDPEMREPDAQQEPAALTVSSDDFAALEERVLRAVTLVKQERKARVAAEERLIEIEEQAREQAAQAEKTQAELGALKAERDQVRVRVERLLQQLDELEL